MRDRQFSEGLTLLTLDINFFLIAAPAVVFAGISKGGFGSGAAFAAASILALVVPPGLALSIMLPMLMLIDLVSLRSYWAKWAWAETRLLMISGVPGVALGAVLYSVVDDDALRVLIGVISVAFVMWRILLQLGWVQMGRTPLGPKAGIVAGLTAGFTSFISHAGGPPVAVYLLSRGITKTQYQASTVLVFWVINIAKFVPYAFLGMFTSQTGIANLGLAPFAVLGAWIGVKAHHLVSERLFFGLTYVILVATGSKLIWDGFN